MFRIGCMTEKEFKILEHVLKQIRDQYPYIRPKVIVRDFFDLKNLYENQQLELVIATRGLSTQGYYKKVTTYQSYVVMPSDHPLAKCGYGIALLPGFVIPDDKEVVCVPVADTKNIEYGFYYRSSEKHVKYFMEQYFTCIAVL